MNAGSWNHTIPNEQARFLNGSLLQRVAAWFRRSAVAERQLRHVETLPLGGKRSLFLVECDGVRFLVAGGGDSLSAPVALHGENAVRENMLARGDAL